MIMKRRGSLWELLKALLDPEVSGPIAAFLWIMIGGSILYWAMPLVKALFRVFFRYGT